MRMRVWSLASLSGLKIQHCCELWCRLQTWLRFRVAVAVAYASSYSSDLTPSLGTSICCGCCPPPPKKKVIISKAYVQIKENKTLSHLQWRTFATKVSSPLAERTVNIRRPTAHLWLLHLKSLTFKSVGPGRDWCSCLHRQVVLYQAPSPLVN